MAYPASQCVLENGHRLLSYRIGRVLGHDASSVTYLARDINLHKTVVIKEFFPNQYSLRGAGSADVRLLSTEAAQSFKWAMDYFLSHARMLARFEHPNIIRVLDVFEENGTAYMVTHDEHGVSLANLLKRRRTLNEKQLAKIIVPLLDGLKVLHAGGFIHRGIKPSNIHIRKDGTPVLLNFCLARQSIKELSHGYAPIEQYSGGDESQGPWTDIYAMGATLYQAVTGEVPPSAVDRSGVLSNGQDDLLLPASQLISELMLEAYSLNFLATIDHALAFRAQDRPQNIAEWRGEFGFAGARDAATQSEEESAEKEIADDNEDQFLADKIYEELADEIIDYRPGSKKPGRDQALNEKPGSTESPVPASRQDTEQAELFARFSRYRDAPGMPGFHTGKSDSIAGSGSADELQDLKITHSEPTADELEALLLDMTSSGPLTDESTTDTETEPEYRRRRVTLGGLMMGGLYVVAGGLLGIFMLSHLTDPIWEWPAADIASETDTRDRPDVAGQAEEALDQTDRTVVLMQPADIAPSADQPEAVPPSRSPDTEPTRRQADIEGRLVKARADLAARRLTTPAGNNAYEKYQSILEDDPDNQAAHEGLQKIVDLYLYIARDSMTKGNFRHAEEMLRRAATVDPLSSSLLQAHADLEQRRTEARPSPQPAAVQRDDLDDNPASPPPARGAENHGSGVVPSPPLSPVNEAGETHGGTVPSPPVRWAGSEGIHGGVVPSPPLPPASDEETRGSRPAPSPPLSPN